MKRNILRCDLTGILGKKEPLTQAYASSSKASTVTFFSEKSNLSGITRSWFYSKNHSEVPDC